MNSSISIQNTIPSNTHSLVSDVSIVPKEKCSSTCCVQEVARPLRSYNPNSTMSKKIPSVEDRIGILEMMKYVPEVFYYPNSGNIGKKFKHIPLTQKIIPCLEPGTIISISTCSIEHFFQHMYPLLEQPFVLFSTNCDNGAPGRFHKFIRTGDDKKKGLIMHWYASNCDMNAEEVDHLTCVPLGFAQQNDHQKSSINELLSSITGLTHQYGRPQFPKHIEDKRHGLALIAYNLGNARDSEKYKNRAELTDHMCGKGRGMWKGENVTCINLRTDLLYEFSLLYKFMLSPRGDGLDCYRTWEALFLGMGVVVKTSTLDSMYEDLPVLIVKEWSELNPELLHRTWERFKNQYFDFRHLYIRTWQLEMASFRVNSSLAYKYRIL